MANPGFFLLLQLLGLVALGIFALALLMLYGATRRRSVAVIPDRPAPGKGSGLDHPGATPPLRVAMVEESRWSPKRRWLLIAALTLLLLLFAGKFLGMLFMDSGSRAPALPAEATSRVVQGASGAALAITEFGPANGPILLFTHGWGNDHRQWLYMLSVLPAKYHVVVWDLPGLGTSTAAKDYSLQTMSDDLATVVSQFKDRPMVLVGHSIGGMLNLELFKNHPDQFAGQVRGLVELDTTYKNPVLTKKGAETSAKLQKPVFEPLLHVIEWISPVARAGGWFAYQSGLAHLQLASDSFTGSESWTQLDHMARYSYESSPGIIARGTLGMLHWDASGVLSKVNVPTLVIVGQQDTTTLPSAAEHIAREVPSAQLVAVDKAAHLGPVEQYKRYAEEIDRFATTVFAGPSK